MARTYTARQKRLKVKIVGGKKIANNLKRMGNKASDVLMDVAKKGGKIALDDAKRNCPVDTGALRDSLKLEENIKKPTKADVKVDYDKSLKYGTFVELGSRGKPANPFLRNAVDNNAQEIADKITNELGKAISRKW